MFINRIYIELCSLNASYFSCNVVEGALGTYWGYWTETGGRDSSVGIATCYGLDGPGIESRWEARFSALVQTGPAVHPASCAMGNGSFPGVKRPGRGVDHPPPSSAEIKGIVELYLYSPSGPLWPVLGFTLHLPLPLRDGDSRLLRNFGKLLLYNTASYSAFIMVTVGRTYLLRASFMPHSPQTNFLISVVCSISLPSNAVINALEYQFAVATASHQ